MLKISIVMVVLAWYQGRGSRFTSEKLQRSFIVERRHSRIYSSPMQTLTAFLLSMLGPRLGLPTGRCSYGHPAYSTCNAVGLHNGLEARHGGASWMLASTKKVVKKSGAKSRGKGFGKATNVAKGFGKVAGIGKDEIVGKLLNETQYDVLRAWLVSSSKTNLDKVAIAEFDGLRGVMALRDIVEGEEIIGIPGQFAVNLGTEANDPLPAAQKLLATRAIELELDHDVHSKDLVDVTTPLRAAYWDTLPLANSSDLSTPDFFTDDVLQMLQWPPLIERTKRRISQIHKVLGLNASSNCIESNRCVHDLLWATWLVESRAISVLGPLGDSTYGHSLMGTFKCLIPFMDMFNHKADSKNQLRGRLDGMLRIVAGGPIKAGEQITFAYGDPSTSNEEFVGHYGFHDQSLEVSRADRAHVRKHSDSVAALKATSPREDKSLLAAASSYQEQLAIKLRLSLKLAAAKEGLLFFPDD